MSRIPSFHAVWFKGVVQGQRATFLVDRGETYRFIDAKMVEIRNFHTKYFSRFTIMILGNHSMDCTKWIPKLQVTIGDYTMIDNLYVVNVSDTNIEMGVQWLLSNANIL